MNQRFVCVNPGSGAECDRGLWTFFLNKAMASMRGCVAALGGAIPNLEAGVSQTWQGLGTVSVYDQ